MPDIGIIKREGKWSTKYVWVQCPDCRQERWIRLTNYRRGGKTGLCLKCFNIRQRTSNRAYRTPDGHLLHDGYVLVRQPGHHRAVYGGFVKRAVLVMETSMSRQLQPTEHLHHINGKRDDDRPENIAVVNNRQHALLHGLGVKIKYKKQPEPNWSTWLLNT